MLTIRQEHKARTNDIKAAQPADVQRKLEQISVPGASSWLGALPLSNYGFDLCKGEFQDALCLRYNKQLKNLPALCPCNQKFTVTHALNCKKGGFINARHNNVRDLEAHMMKRICNDVEIEPPLQPVNNPTNFGKSAITKKDARHDIRTRGFWRPGQNAFFDVRITNAECNSQASASVKSVLRKHETEKKRQYNQRAPSTRITLLCAVTL